MILTTILLSKKWDQGSVVVEVIVVDDGYLAVLEVQVFLLRLLGSRREVLVDEVGFVHLRHRIHQLAQFALGTRPYHVEGALDAVLRRRFQSDFGPDQL